MKSKNNNFKFSKKKLLTENNICPKSTTSKIVCNVLVPESIIQSNKKAINDKKYNDISPTIKISLNKNKQNKNNYSNNKNLVNNIKNANLFQSSSEINIEKNWSSNKKNYKIKNNRKIIIDENNISNYFNYEINKNQKENNLSINNASHNQISNKEYIKNNKKITNNNQQQRNKEILKGINNNYHSNKSTNVNKKFNKKVNLQKQKPKSMKKKIIGNPKNFKLKKTYKSPTNKTKDSSKNHSKSNNTSSNTSNIKTSVEKKLLNNMKGVKIESINLDLNDKINENNFNLTLTTRKNYLEEDNYSASISRKSSFSSYYKLRRLCIKRDQKKMMNSLHKNVEKSSDKINSLFIDFYKNIISDKNENSFNKIESTKLIDRIRKAKKLNKS